MVVLGVAGILMLLVTATACGQATPAGSTAPAGGGLPLTAVTAVPLPGDTGRVDYASLDPAAHRLFIAHLGASQVIEVDTTTNQVLNVIDNIPGVHGVLVVPELHRVFATATTSNEVLTLDEDTGTVLSRAPAGDYPDGLAYDPTSHRVWVTNETGGTETVLDTTTGQIVGTVDVGGDAGNVAYDPAGRILVAVQSRDQVVVIDPTTLTVTQRVDIPGCDHLHGLALDPDHRVGFVACDGNATLHTLDLDTYQTSNPQQVGDNPDVLAFDPGNARLYSPRRAAPSPCWPKPTGTSAFSVVATSPPAPTSSPSTPPPTAATTPSPKDPTITRNYSSKPPDDNRTQIQVAGARISKIRR